MLLPTPEPAPGGTTTLVGTSSNAATAPKLTKINAADIGNIFGLLPEDTPAGLLPEGPNFAKTNLPQIVDHFHSDCSDTDQFKFVKLPTIFPLPYGTAAIKGSILDDSVGDALRNITDTTGPIWIKLISEWTQLFANAILAYPAATAFLPALKKD
mmetsp:Transcript_8528/g.18673  ORF Transcript_8528/g.18673 Transcript_8528/m.18673 type:complete len:155 (+) Transcript_8528:877-1341(+)